MADVMGYASRNNNDNAQRVFDWNKAAKFIRDGNVKRADAGLQEDWKRTGGAIFKNGKPVMDEYTYLASAWATPVLKCYYSDDADELPEVIDCWLYANETNFNEKTKWAKSALKILKEG